jgi:hypothetical protein
VQRQYAAEILFKGTAERPHPVNLVHPVLGENRRKLTDRMNRMNRIPGWRTKD